MTTKTLSPRQRAHQLILDAIATGVRGDLLDALKEAEHLAAPSNTSRALTQLHYDRLQPGQKLLDKDRSGLLMRHGKRTGKGWFFRYSHPVTGKQIEYRFGSYPEMPLSEARDRWADLRSMRNHGQDPATVERPMVPRFLTISDLVGTYLSEYARKVKRSHKTDERLLRTHLVHGFGSMIATDFGQSAAVSILHSVYENSGPREAEKLRACISTMFNFASGRTRKVLVKSPLLPATHPNPVAAVLLPKRDQKNHKPTPKELASYAKALKDGSVPYADVLRFQLLTMARISEAAQAAWAEFDLDQGRWKIPAERAKNGHEHIVLLSTQALDLLTRIYETVQSEFVFPASQDNTKPMAAQQAQRALAKNRSSLGVSGRFTSHSVRHAGLTWAAENGCPREIRDRLTNHVSGGGIDAVYNGAELNGPAKDWWGRWADHLDMLTMPNDVLLDAQLS